MLGRSEDPEFSNPPLIAVYFSKVEFRPKANTVYRVRFWNPEMSFDPIVGLFLRSVVCMNSATSSIPDSSPFVHQSPRRDGSPATTQGRSRPRFAAAGQESSGAVEDRFPTEV